MIINKHFFSQLPLKLAPALLGKVLRHRVYDEAACEFVWLSAMIIETEAYYLMDKGSHSSLGYTEKRKAMFMPAGTIYMYYARGRDSLNFSASGTGNAVLIKSGYPYFDALSPRSTLPVMQRLNPAKKDVRPLKNLCNGQTLLCRSLGLKVTDWNQAQLTRDSFYLDDVGYTPQKIIQCRRLGISPFRDADLPYRFVDQQFAPFCTSNPMTRRNRQAGTDYTILSRKTSRN